MLPDREPEWAAEHSNTFPGWEFFVPLVEPHPHTLFSLLERPVAIWDEPIDREDQIRSVLAALNSSFEEVRDIVPPRPRPQDGFLTELELRHALAAIPQVALKELALESLPPPAGSAPRAVVIGETCISPPRSPGAVTSGEGRARSKPRLHRVTRSPHHPTRPYSRPPPTTCFPASRLQSFTPASRR